jgi:hypothetical protein
VVLWDSQGVPYIVTKDKVFFTKQRCAIKAYQYDDMVNTFLYENKSRLGIRNGHRVDHKNHNWLIFQEYLSLPFSYLTFVIKDKIENDD